MINVNIIIILVILVLVIINIIKKNNNNNFCRDGDDVGTQSVQERILDEFVSNFDQENLLWRLSLVLSVLLEDVSF